MFSGIVDILIIPSFQVSHVIDSCFVKLACFNNETFNNSLIITEVSQASAEQRAGRAGRTRPGEFLKYFHNSLTPRPPREVLPPVPRERLPGAATQHNS